jgi:hypothetical protein
MACATLRVAAMQTGIRVSVSAGWGRVRGAHLDVYSHIVPGTVKAAMQLEMPPLVNALMPFWS